MRVGIPHLRGGVLAIALIRRAVSLSLPLEEALRRMSSDPGLPGPNPTTPYWMETPPFPELQDVRHGLPKEADVVIIGSGITGAAAAKTICELSSHGAAKQPRIVVLEARQLCSGATARNGGHIKQVPHVVFSNYRRMFGDEGARRMLQFELRHLEILLEVGREIPQGEVREVETADFYVDNESFNRVKQGIVEIRKVMGDINVTVWDGKDAREKFGVNEFVVGAVSYTAGALWPFRLVTGVWSRLVKKHANLSINTHTPVEAITASNASGSYLYQVQTPRGSLRARHVIHATNAFAPHLVPALRGHIAGVVGHMTAQRPGRRFPSSHGKRSWATLYYVSPDYITQRPDGKNGSPGDLMVGGGLFRSRGAGIDQFGVWDDSSIDVLTLEHLRGSMSTIFDPNWGADGGLKKAWSGVQGFSGDSLPLVGPLPPEHGITAGPQYGGKGLQSSGQWIAAGYTGEGMVRAWLSGTAVGVMVLGRDEENLERGVGRPGGRLDEWFPRKELAIDEGRLNRTDLRNLVQGLA